MIICLPNEDMFGRFHKQPYDNIYDIFIENNIIQSRVCQTIIK